MRRVLLLIGMSAAALHGERVAAQAVRWEYGQLITNGVKALAWIAPDSQHVFCAPAGGKDALLVVVDCEFQAKLVQIAVLDIALNRHPSTESRARAAAYDADTMGRRSPTVAAMLNALGEERGGKLSVRRSSLASATPTPSSARGSAKVVCLTPAMLPNLLPLLPIDKRQGGAPLRRAPADRGPRGLSRSSCRGIS